MAHNSIVRCSVRIETCPTQRGKTLEASNNQTATQAETALNDAVDSGHYGTTSPVVVDNGQSDQSDTHVTIRNTGTSNDRTDIDNGQITYTGDKTMDQHVQGHWPAEADEHVRELIDDAQEERQRIENKRANHRNFNRLMTLLVAIVAGFVITWSLEHNYIPHGQALGPYSFVITVLLDASLTLYALIRHY